MITIVAMLVVIIGAINWFSIAVANFDIVQWVFSYNASLHMGPQIVYGIIGVAGMWLFIHLLMNKFSPKRIGATCPYIEKKKTEKETAVK